jgi:uncharacterized protein
MKHEPPRMNEGAPHWKAAREGRLDLPYCGRCARYAWPPAGACRSCGGTVEWRACSGQGRVAAFSVVRRAVDPALKDDVPYVVAVRAPAPTPPRR